MAAVEISMRLGSYWGPIARLLTRQRRSTNSKIAAHLNLDAIRIPAREQTRQFSLGDLAIAASARMLLADRAVSRLRSTTLALINSVLTSPRRGEFLDRPGSALTLDGSEHWDCIQALNSALLEWSASRDLALRFAKQWCRLVLEENQFAGKEAADAFRSETHWLTHLKDWRDHVAHGGVPWPTVEFASDLTAADVIFKRGANPSVHADTSKIEVSVLLQDFAIAQASLEWLFGEWCSSEILRRETHLS